MSRCLTLLALVLAACAVAPAPRLVLETTDAPKAIGAYSQGVLVPAGRMLYTAGQIGIDPRQGKLVSDDVEAQTEQALDNLASVLLAGDMSFADVVLTTIYLTNLDDYKAVNAVYAKRFTAPPPARATVQVAGLPAGAKVEIQMIAVRP